MLLLEIEVPGFRSRSSNRRFLFRNANMLAFAEQVSSESDNLFSWLAPSETVASSSSKRSTLTGRNETVEDFSLKTQTPGPLPRSVNRADAELLES